MFKKILVALFFISSNVWACNQGTTASNTDKNSDVFNVMMLVPSTERDNFWQDFRQFSQAVASSLNVNLCTHYFEDGERNRYFYAEALEKIFKDRNTQPDIIIGMFWLSGESNLLDLIEQRQIPFISFNSSLSAKDFVRLGYPGERYKYWLAHMSPDDVLAGHQLAEMLTSELSPKKSPVMFGFSGDRISAAGYNRVLGLQAAASKLKDLELRQTVYTNWYDEDAKAKALTLFERHKTSDINLVWSASDLIAQGVINAIEERGLNAGNDILVGGMDWSIESRRLIGEGKMLLSLGGHFIEGGLATILAYDYLQGHDFRTELGSRLKTQMRPMTQSNIKRLLPYIQRDKWTKLDFRGLSKHYNPQLKHYDFSLETLLQMKENAF